MTNNKIYMPGSFLQFSPCILYIALYTFLYTYSLFTQNLHNASMLIIPELPLFVLLVTTVYAFFTFKKPISIDEKIKIFLSGSINQSSSYFFCSFIGAAIFVHTLAKIGAIPTMVTIQMMILPAYWILPSFFIVALMNAMMIRSWIVSIIFCMPIACGVALSLQINPALMTATVASGVICGYQISISFVHAYAYEKMKEMLWLVLPAALCTLLVLSMYDYQIPHPALYQSLRASLWLQDYVTLLPIILFFGIAMLHVDLVVNLFLGSSFAIILGLIQKKISYLDAMSSVFEGFYSQRAMMKLLILFIFLAGLTNIINYNHGFHYIIDKIQHKIKNLYVRQMAVIFIILFVSCIIAFDVLSITILIPMMKKISDRYNVSYQKSTILLYLIATASPCFLPYAPIILLASYLSHSSPVQIIQYMFYPIILLVWIVISICIFKPQKTFKKYFYRSGN